MDIFLRLSILISTFCLSADGFQCQSIYKLRSYDDSLNLLQLVMVNFFILKNTEFSLWIARFQCSGLQIFLILKQLAKNSLKPTIVKAQDYT